jgi:hypothetical protein
MYGRIFSVAPDLAVCPAINGCLFERLSFSPHTCTASVFHILRECIPPPQSLVLASNLPHFRHYLRLQWRLLYELSVCGAVVCGDGDSVYLPRSVTVMELSRHFYSVEPWSLIAHFSSVWSVSFSDA